MPCKVGITTDLNRRKGEWQAIHPTLKNWKELGSPHDTRESAQNAENLVAVTSGCEHAPGGREPNDPDAKWHVYRFDY